MPPPLRISVEWLRSTLSPQQIRILGLPEKGEFEITRLKENEWSIATASSSEFSPVSNPLHAKVLHLLHTHKVQDLIEGRFERLLSDVELQVFNELLSSGKIIAVKTNPKYEKGIYRVAKGENDSIPRVTTIRVPIPEKAVDEYSLLHDGFQVLRTEGAAKAASFDLAERIRAGEIKGIKSFDGFYYLIENILLEKNLPPLVECVKGKKKMELEELSKETHFPLVLARIILEFAKEDGIIIEKKKNTFAYVG
jgi:hypothetical protein